MGNRFTRSRKYALRYLGLSDKCSMSYSDIAKRIVFKEASIVDGIDLDNKLMARSLIEDWAFRHEYRNRKHETD